MSEARQSWREVFPIHPAAELLPQLPADELTALGEDIKANGMYMPISILHDEGFMPLDGRNRLDGMEMVVLDVPALLTPP